jgi:heptosyltransferase-2
MSRRRRALLHFADSLGRAAVSPFRHGAPAWRSPDSIQRILVIEPWNIGDVILATPLLRALRTRYPKSEISLLAKPHASDLLKHSGLVDEVIPCDLPWTASANKYRMSRPIVGGMRSLVHALRHRHFDVTLDARMDTRSNILAAATGAPHRIGYDIGGGGWLLTEALPSDRDGSHKIDDWLSLLDLMPGGGQSRASNNRELPTLAITEEERAAASAYLSIGGAERSPVIGYHPGGSHPGKRWPRERFEELLRELSTSYGGTHIVFLGPDEQGASTWPGAVVSRPDLRQLMAQIACCDVLVCNDSGPMHIADALGVPVVALFEMGNPQWYGPCGPRATVIKGELAGQGLSAAPLDTPPAHPIAVERVRDAVKASLTQQLA